MIRVPHLASLVLAFALLASACSDGDAATTTAPPPTPTVTVPTSAPVTSTSTPELTRATSTTTVPASSTTAAAPAITTTRAVNEVADALVATRISAVAAVVPTGWDSTVTPSPAQEDSDEVGFAACTGPDDFDLVDLNLISLAAAEVTATGPEDEVLGGAPDASVEVRVIESEALAVEVFRALDQVIGTPEGRRCLANNMAENLEGQLPTGTQFGIVIEDLDAAGADIAGRIVMDVTIGESTIGLTLDLTAVRVGSLTVLGSFIGFGTEFDPALRDAMVAAARDV